MRKLILSAFFLLCLFIPAVSRAEPVTVDPGFTRRSLGLFMQYYLDRDNVLDIQTVSQDGFSGKLGKFNNTYPSIGYTKGSLWLAFSILNTTTQTVNMILEYDYPVIDEVHLFIPEENGFLEKIAGDHFPVEKKDIPYRSIAFRLAVKPGVTPYYLKVRTSGSMTVPVKLYSVKTFENTKIKEMTLLGLYYGIMLALILYNIFIFFTMRDRSFIYLALFGTCLSIYSCIHTGIAYQYVWPDSIWFANISHPLFLTLSIVFALQFSRTYLRTEQYRLIDVCIKALLAAGALTALTPFCVDYYYSTQLSTIFTAITIIFLMITGFLLCFKKKREVIFYLLSWIFVLVGGIFSAARAFGIIEESFFSTWMYQIGSPVIVLLLSIGIGDRIKIMRKEHDDAIDALKESEEKYRTVVDNAQDGIVVIMDEMPLYANKKFISMLGYAESEFYRHHFLDFFPDTPTGKRMVHQIYLDRMSDKEAPPRYETQMQTSTGEIIDATISATGTLISGKKCSICIITDITEQKKSQKIIMEQFEQISSQYREMEKLNSNLRDAHARLVDANREITDEKERLAATLGAIGDAVVVYDRDGIVRMINPNAEKITGWPIQEAPGKKAEDIVNLKDLPARDLIFGKYPRQFDPNPLDTIGVPFAMTDRNGHERIIEISGAHIKTDRGESGGVVLAIRDISVKVQMEKGILNMSKMESLGVLAGGIAHDFNNLLTGITGNISIARSKAKPGDGISPLLEKIEQAGKRAINLTHQLLTFSKGGEPIKKTSDITDVIRESTDLILTGSKLRVEYDFQKGLWPVDIDHGQISQVFNNMIINSMQAMKGPGTIRISAINIDDIRNLAPLPDGNYIAVAISDTGAGISRDNLSKIFDPYFTTKNGGSGLGLASSYSIIKKHNGYIDVVSEEGKGSTFTVYLKASDSEVAESIVETGHKFRGSGKILILDDEAIIQDVTASMLSHLGYRSVAVSSGEQAISRYQEAMDSGEAFDAVIMDLTIPGGMGGKEAIGKILNIDPAVKAVVSSGYSEDPVMANYRKYGFSGVLLKPYKLQDLSALLEKLFGDT